MHAPSGGIASPMAAASTTSAAAGTPTGSAPMTHSSAPAEHPPITQHARLATTVDELAEQGPADAERHGVHAGDDARRRVGAREGGPCEPGATMASIASGRRARIEMTRMRSAPGLEVSVFMCPMLGAHWSQRKIQTLV